MKIITVSREFGSGGRELGKRMADLLGFEYYDKEIVTMIAEKHGLDETYVSNVLEKGMTRAIPITIGRTFSYATSYQEQSTKILVANQQIIKELAGRGDCVIIGQCADILLREYHSFNLFVYAEMTAKIERCRERAPENEHLTDNEMMKIIKQIDAKRTKQTEILTALKWGQKERYHLCINTTGLDIKSLSSLAADYATYWFERTEG